MISANCNRAFQRTTPIVTRGIDVCCQEIGSETVTICFNVYIRTDRDSNPRPSAGKAVALTNRVIAAALYEVIKAHVIYTRYSIQIQ